MSKYSFLFLFFWLSIVLSNAQVGLGVESGLNFYKPNIRHSSTIHARSDVNMYFGISPYYKFSQRMSLILEVKYSKLGFKFVHLDQFEKKNRFGYLSISQKFEHNVYKNVSVGFGMYYSVLLSNHDLRNGVWHNTTSRPPVLDTDIGINASVKYVYKNFYWLIGYQYGLQDINSLKYGEGSPYLEVASDLAPTDQANYNRVNYEFFTRNVQLGVGYILKI